MYFMDKQNSETFLKTSYFVFHLRNEAMQVWNDMSISKWWQIYIFCWAISLGLQTWDGSQHVSSSQKIAALCATHVSSTRH